MDEAVVTMSGLPYVAAGPDVTYPNGWFESAPFADQVTRLCLGAFGGIRGHVKAHPDGSFTAFHGDLQLGTVKDLDKAKTAVETGKKIRQRGESKKRNAAREAAKGAGSGQTQAAGIPQPTDGAVTGTDVAPMEAQATAVPQPGLGSVPAPAEVLPVPTLPLPPPPPLAAVDPTVQGTLNLANPIPFPVGGQVPLPLLPAETAAAKPKADDIITLDQLRGFMPADWCDQLEGLAVQGFQLKDAELQSLVGFRGSNDKKVPKYYDGPPQIGVEPMIRDMFKQTGLDKVRVPGGLIMLVPGTSEGRLNREKLLRAGVTIEVIEACTDPGTPYTSLTFKRDRKG